MFYISFPGGTSGQELACQCRICKRCRFSPWSGRSPGGRHGNPLQYSCLENPMDRGAWQATGHGVAKSWTQLNDLAHMHVLYSQYTAALFKVHRYRISAVSLLYSLLRRWWKMWDFVSDSHQLKAWLYAFQAVWTCL